MAHAVRIIIVSVFVGKAAQAAATVPNQASCWLHPATPDTTIRVEGFPAERLYLHPKHPDVCQSGGRDCVATAYVVSGDKIEAGQDCDDWTFVSFKGKRKATSGWVATRRLPEIATHFDIDVSPAKVSHPVCLAAQAAWNESLTHGAIHLPDFATETASSTNLPEGVGEDANGDITVANARIHGRDVKVVSYTTGGTCHDSVVQLWTADFKNSIDVPGSSTENGMANYSSDSLIALRGEPYFAHADRGAKNISLYAFDSQLETHLACQLNMTQRIPEGIESSTDAALCRAVLTGEVTGAPIDDIDSVSLPDIRGQATLVARGRVDIDNDGKSDDVGIIEYSEDSGAGCGFEYHASWPVKLGTDGLPAGSAVNDVANKVSVTNSDSRLFTYKGVTYYELRSRPGADASQHEVWRLTAGEPIKACVFQPVRYDAVDGSS